MTCHLPCHDNEYLSIYIYIFNSYLLIHMSLEEPLLDECTSLFGCVDISRCDGGGITFGNERIDFGDKILINGLGNGCGLRRSIAVSITRGDFDKGFIKSHNDLIQLHFLNDGRWTTDEVDTRLYTGGGGRSGLLYCDGHGATRINITIRGLGRHRRLDFVRRTGRREFPCSFERSPPTEPTLLFGKFDRGVTESRHRGSLCDGDGNITPTPLVIQGDILFLEHNGILFQCQGILQGSQFLIDVCNHIIDLVFDSTTSKTDVGFSCGALRGAQEILDPHLE